MPRGSSAIYIIGLWWHKTRVSFGPSESKEYRDTHSNGQIEQDPQSVCITRDKQLETVSQAVMNREVGPKVDYFPGDRMKLFLFCWLLAICPNLTWTPRDLHREKWGRGWKRRSFPSLQSEVKSERLSIVSNMYCGMLKVRGFSLHLDIVPHTWPMENWWYSRVLWNLIGSNIFARSRESSVEMDGSLLLSQRDPSWWRDPFVGSQVPKTNCRCKEIIS